MADKNKGWIKTYRDIQNHWIWNCDKFTRGQAWIDLLLMASYKDHTFPEGGSIKREKPGQKWTSLRDLALRWRWDKSTVKKFLNLLMSDGMITYDAQPHIGTLITIVNWGDFQSKDRIDPDNESDNESDNMRTICGQRTRQKTDIHKNSRRNAKNDKELKEKKRLPFLDERGLPPLDYNPEGEGQ